MGQDLQRANQRQETAPGGANWKVRKSCCPCFGKFWRVTTARKPTASATTRIAACSSSSNDIAISCGARLSRAFQRRNTSLLLVALLLAGTGEKLWLGFAPKYIETLGGSILDHRTFRRAANISRRDLCLSRRLADRSLGTKKIAAAVQRHFHCRLRFGFGLAKLARAAARLIFVSRMERAVAARDIFRHRHVAAKPPAHDGRRRAIHDPPRADDARPADRRLAAHALRLDGRRALRARAVHHNEPADGGVSVVHVRAGNWQG
jgi:hypothetical protein